MKTPSTHPILLVKAGFVSGYTILQWTIIALCMGIVYSGQTQAAAIRYVGSVTNSENSQVAEWQNSLVNKRFTLQASNLYGSKLAVNWVHGSIGQHSYGSSGFGWSYNNTNTTQGDTTVSINNLGLSTMTTAGWQSESLAFGLTGMQTDFDGHTIRVGVMMDIFGGVSDPDVALRLSQTSGTGGGDSGVIYLHAATGTPAFYFFDIDNVSPQDVFQLKALNSSGDTSGTYIGPVTFDRSEFGIQAPFINPAGGYFKGSFAYTIHTSIPDATVHYTTDGSDPTAASPVFTQGTPLTWNGGSGTISIKAIAVDTTGSSSAVATAYFHVSSNRSAAIPEISPDGGNSTGAASVSLTCATAGASIYYTLDGSYPTTASNLYTGSFSIGSSSAASEITVRALAVKSGLPQSGVVSAKFLCGAVTTSSSVTATTSQSFTGWLGVIASSSDPSAIIRYTVDGSIPNAKSTQYTGAKCISTTTVMKFRAFTNGQADGSVTTAIYTALDSAITDISVATYGILPENSSTLNQTNLGSCLWAIANTGGNSSAPKRIRLYFPKGTYLFDGGINISGCNNLILDGQGSTLIFHCNGDSGTPFYIGANTWPAPNNLLIKDFTLQVASPQLASGYVTATDGDAMDILLDRYSSADSVIAASSPSIGFLQYEPADYANSRGGLDVYLDDPGWSATKLGPKKIRVSPKGDAFRGSYLCLRGALGDHLIYIEGGQGIALQNLLLLDSEQMGVVASKVEDLTLDRVCVVRSFLRPRAMTLAADGFHFGQLKGNVTIKDCTVQNQGDDGVNIGGSYFLVQSVSGTSMTIAASSWTPDLSVGDEIEFRDASFMTFKGKTVVTAVTTPSPQTTPETQILTLSTSVSATEGDYVGSLTWTPRVYITRCTFSGNRARGTLIQTPGAIIENNRYFNLGSNAIHLTTSGLPWNEASPPSGSRVLNNSMEDCSRGADWEVNASVMVNAGYTSGGENVEPDAGVVENVILADNSIIDSDNTGIYMSSVGGADIINNTIQNCSLSPVSANSYSNDAMWVKNSSHVRIIGNTQSNTNYVRYRYNPEMPVIPSGGIDIQPFLTQVTFPSLQVIRYATSWNVQQDMSSYSGYTAFMVLCDSGGNIVQTWAAGNIAAVNQWPNGERLAGPAVFQSLAGVPDGSYTVRVGLQQGSTRLRLVGENDADWRVIVGTITISGSGSSYSYSSSQYQVQPRIVNFVPTGPRSFDLGVAWENFDTLPAGLGTFAHICDAAGNLVSGGGAIGSTPDTARWSPGTIVSSTLQSWNLPTEESMPDGEYTVRLGIYPSSGPRLPIYGPNDDEYRIVAGTLTVGTGTKKVIVLDAGTTSDITYSVTDNPGF